MVAHRLGDQGHLRHEAERLHKVGEAQLTAQLVAVELPLGQLLGQGSPLLGGEGDGGHDVRTVPAAWLNRSGSACAPRRAPPTGS